MTEPGKPQGYSTVSPYLVAVHAQAVLDFATKAFGAAALRRYERADGSILHAEMRIGDSVVMIGEAGEQWPATPCHLHVYVTDVDRVYAAAVAAGGAPIQAPSRKAGDPDRRGGVRDPAGNSWWIATEQPAENVAK